MHRSAVSLFHNPGFLRPALSPPVPTFFPVVAVPSLSRLVRPVARSLNSCCGVISETDFLCTSETEILEGLSDQVTKSPTTTQANLLPSTSSATFTTSSESQPHISVTDTALTTSNSLSTSAASSSFRVSIFTPLQ
ncbi:hypothetical protein TNCV_1619701 [Trichonephila clavipes]|nr:hypothetical protein TNCV_1619701 [Trichonephila clavipes]